LEVKKTFKGLELQGSSEKLKDASFIVKGTLKGNVEVECIKCLQKYTKPIKEDVNFKIVKPPYKGFDEEYDIIEMDKFDIEELLKSEYESIQNDYNVCPKCENEKFNKEY
jgi:uncharacterized metal-binding protein YceD (DUF177 family)